MAKAIGLLLLVTGIWAAAEIGTKGLDGAFGGVLSSNDAPPAETRSTAQRAGGAFERAYGSADDRRERLLED